MRSFRLTLRAATAGLAVAALASIPTLPAGAADGWQAEAVASSQPGGQGCAQVLFVGARGSGEPAGFGRTVTEIRDSIASYPNVTQSVRQVWLDYPAVQMKAMGLQDAYDLLLNGDESKVAYFSSVRNGADELARLLVDNLTRCPGERVVVVGYSQGAEAANRGITEAVASEPRVADQLLDVVLAGNPAHYPGQPVNEPDSTSSPDATGLAATAWYLRSRVLPGQVTKDEALQNLIQAVFDMYNANVSPQQLTQALTDQQYALPSSVSGKVYSVCMAGDLVCDAVPAFMRLLSAQSTLDQEMARARPLHSNYSQVMPVTLNRVATDLTKLAKQQAQRPGGQQTPGQGPNMVVWLIAVAAVLVVAAFVLTRLRRRGAAKHLATSEPEPRLRLSAAESTKMRVRQSDKRPKG